MNRLCRVGVAIAAAVLGGCGHHSRYDVCGEPPPPPRTQPRPVGYEGTVSVGVSVGACMKTIDPAGTHVYCPPVSVAPPEDFAGRLWRVRELLPREPFAAAFGDGVHAVEASARLTGPATLEMHLPGVEAPVHAVASDGELGCA